MMAQHFVARVTPQPRSKERKKKSGGGGVVHTCDPGTKEAETGGPGI